MQKKVYIIAPLTNGETEDNITIFKNIDNALDTAETLLKMGLIPYVPHLTYFWHAKYQHDHNFWLTFDCHWMNVCDIGFRLAGESKEGDIEEKYFWQRGVPVFYSLEVLTRWLTLSNEVENNYATPSNAPILSDYPYHGTGL